MKTSIKSNQKQKIKNKSDVQTNIDKHKVTALLILKKQNNISTYI